MLDSRREDGDAVGGTDGRQGRPGQTAIEECRDPEVGAANDVRDGSIDRRVDACARRERCGQHGDPERNAESRERRAQWPRPERSPGEGLQPAHGCGLEPHLGEPCDQRRRRVIGAPSEEDLVGDPAVRENEDAIGVRGGL